MRKQVRNFFSHALLAAFTFALWPLARIIFECAATKEKNQFKKNVKYVLGIDPASHAGKKFYRLWQWHHFRALLETLLEIALPSSIEMLGFDEYQAALQHLMQKQNSGAMIITGHIGSWELVAKYSKLAGQRDLYVLAKPPRHRWFKSILNFFRRRFDVEVFWNDDRSLIKKMLTVMKNKKMLGFVMDQKPAHRQGIPLAFLGYDADFVRGPASIAKKSGTPIIGAYCIRQGELCYRLDWEIIADDPSTMSEEELTRAMAHSIENAIRRNTEQWTWSYKRWVFS